jgi:hypothetical protein
MTEERTNTLTYSLSLLILTVEDFFRVEILISIDEGVGILSNPPENIPVSI